MPSADPRLPRGLRLAWAAFVTVLAVYVVLLAAESASGREVFAFDAHEAIQLVLLLAGTGLVLTRALAMRDQRAAWLVLALGLVSWLGGQLLSTLQAPADGTAPFPSAVDYGLIGFYLAQYVTLFLIARSGLRSVPRATWLDGTIAILLLGTVGAHWLFTPLIEAGGSASGAIVIISYPAADVVLLALVLGVAVLHGGRPGAMWWRLGLGILMTAIADAWFALGSTTGVPPNSTTGPLAVLYTFGAGCLIAAAFRPTDRRPRASLAGWRALAVPSVLFVVVLALLAFDVAADLAPVPMGALTAAIALIGLRAAIAFRENLQLADTRRQALTDELTGLPNRRAAYAELDRRCAAEDAVAVLMIDLDRFKDLNDTLGHLAGDEALVAVAERLTAAIGADGRLSRLGGDEFAVILAPGAGELRALSAARRVLDALDAPVRLEGLLLPIRASIGIASVPTGTEGSREELLRHADVAMYHAKANGSGLEVYAAERDDHSRERLALAADLQDAITGGQLVLHFQPKANLGTGQIAGVEALVRWEHPVHGLVPPADFVPLVERSGLGRMLTLEVIGQALCAERSWRAAGLPHVPVAVNTSAATLLDVRFPDDVAGLLKHWDAPPGALSLELTEETIMTDPQRAQDVLARLSELGIDLSLDDFGTGYSSLSMLKRLPVRELKIDRSFVTDMLEDAGDAAIVRSTVDLARNLGLRVVAEGVESQEAWDLLAGWGCELAQGYHLSRPVPEETLLTLLRRGRGVSDTAAPARPRRDRPAA
jgi:diguanylate cyclase (GGDEF)-like protein